MKHSHALRTALRYIRLFFVILLIVAFVITCCTMLFVSTLRKTMGLTLTQENIGAAAKVTLVNVLVLSLLFTLIDIARRRLTVDRHVNRIARAAERIVAGDFSVRLPVRNLDDPFDRVADCFNRMAQELSSVETLRTDFISNVSHEMKTPLAVMGNYGRLLQTPGLSEQQRMEYAAGVSDASRRMADMISNILKLNKLENQQIFPTAVEFDLSSQLCECLLQFESQWERSGIHVETDLHDTLPVTADPELLELVWNNLLSNAFKFTPAGGTVTVSTAVTEQYTSVQVRDTGCGMSAHVGAHIFEKFYQGDTSHASRGNGLGLALVKRVVDILQAEISVESAPGEGTVFTVRLRRN